MSFSTVTSDSTISNPQSSANASFSSILNFFKSFENSNFIVKVVTSFKSVCSTKGDIIMEEGDFIEDIIFVKDGIITLEICIDLNCSQCDEYSYKSHKCTDCNNGYYHQR